MKLAAMQPYFFPYIGYFQLIAAVDQFIIYDHVSYHREGWFNRNRLLRVNDQPFYITVPIRKHPHQTATYNIQIDNHRLWRRKMLKLMETNYRRAVYFSEIYPLVYQALSGSEERLTDLCCATIRTICGYLDISIPLIQQDPAFEVIEHEIEKAFFNPDMMTTVTGADRKTLRVIKICRHYNANRYINPIGGQAIYSKTVFTEHGIELKFVQTRPYHYTQRTSHFYPNLSIIDVLMNCGKAGTQELLQQYDLV